MELSEGIRLEVSYDLQEVGRVSIALHTDDDGSGVGIVAIGETVIAELRFAEGSPAWETADFSALDPAQVHAVVASIVQVWHEDAVLVAFTVATVDDRDFKCKVAGSLAGATAGILVGAGCGIFSRVRLDAARPPGLPLGTLLSISRTSVTARRIIESEEALDSPDIAPYRPLPPQRWGFLPTNRFWYHASLTPISLVFWAGAAVFFTFFDLFALVWWQQSLGWMVFWWVWAGLVERYTRRYLARRRRALASPRTDSSEGLENATVEAPAGERMPLVEPHGLPSPAHVAPRTLESRLALVQEVESWDLAYEKLFGRGAGVAQFAFNLAFGLALFHPSWLVKLLGILALLAAARGVGSWERRGLGRERAALPPSSPSA
ncbi:hypothetical protein [Nannocystis pusilla]|uniref:hypothetical protein n=1 Tax=Nannocystis pusilla TaxID=889268 RepID=UPI003B78562F